MLKINLLGPHTIGPWDLTSFPGFRHAFFPRTPRKRATPVPSLVRPERGGPCRRILASLPACGVRGSSAGPNALPAGSPAVVIERIRHATRRDTASGKAGAAGSWQWAEGRTDRGNEKDGRDAGRRTGGGIFRLTALAPHGFITSLIRKPYGAVAQLGARLTGSQEVRGSNPLSSTKKKPEPKMAPVSFFRTV